MPEKIRKLKQNIPMHQVMECVELGGDLSKNKPNNLTEMNLVNLFLIPEKQQYLLRISMKRLCTKVTTYNPGITDMLENRSIAREDT